MALRLSAAVAATTAGTATTTSTTSGPSTSEPWTTTTAQEIDSWEVAQADACSGTEVQVDVCPSLPPCGGCEPQDCVLSEWSEWGDGDCTGLCEAQRVVVTENNECGMPCTGALIRTDNDSATCWAPCVFSQNATDCVWTDWSEWSACSKKCDRGQYSRDRHIRTSPRNGGKPCEPLSRQEVGPCNTQPCGAVCVDGVWGEWEEWGECSHSCGGGKQLRSRQIATEASECGVSVSGLGQEYQSCSTGTCEENIDCLFSEWSEWSDCTVTCNGVMDRFRRIEVFGSGVGSGCQGETKEINVCNLPGDVLDCEAEVPVDCVMTEWADWAECTKTCGGGQAERKRLVLTKSAGGGKPCGGPLEETVGCNSASCPLAEGQMPVDCAWGEWSEWGTCEKCNGQRHRYRNILTMAEAGGLPCQFQPTEEAGECPRNCNAPLWCTWAAWAEYGPCTATCGKGTQRRERHLSLERGEMLEEDQVEGVQEDFSTEIAETRGHLTRVTASRTEDLLTSFFGGFLGLTVIWGGCRAFGSKRAASWRSGLRYEQVSGEVERDDDLLVSEDHDGATTSLVNRRSAWRSGMRYEQVTDTSELLGGYGSDPEDLE